MTITSLAVKGPGFK